MFWLSCQRCPNRRDDVILKHPSASLDGETPLRRKLQRVRSSAFDRLLRVSTEKDWSLGNFGHANRLPTTGETVLSRDKRSNRLDQIVPANSGRRHGQAGMTAAQGPIRPVPAERHLYRR